MVSFDMKGREGREGEERSLGEREWGSRDEGEGMKDESD